MFSPRSVEKSARNRTVSTRRSAPTGTRRASTRRSGKRGQDIRANTLYRVKEGDFVYNRLFAWMELRPASAENDDCFVSNEFRCFEVDQSRLSSDFLLYYFSRQEVWTEVQGLSTGSTRDSRNRLSDERFLAMHIPVPPLDEQLAIVATLHGVTKRVEHAEMDARRAGGLSVRLDRRF